jgi:hypothetical protein
VLLHHLIEVLPLPGSEQELFGQGLGLFPAAGGLDSLIGSLE